MNIPEQDEARYTRHGYKDRGDYLNSLAEDRGVDSYVVNMMADILGDSEDFDGLVSELEDMEYSGLLDDFRTESDGGDCDEERG
jgi:hypothetical protein